MRFLPTYLFLPVFLLNHSFTFGQFMLRGNGEVVRETREMPPFTAIHTSSGWDVILIQGNTHSVIVETDENLLEHVVTEVENGELRIYSSENRMKRKRSNVYVTFQSLSNLEATQGADVSAETSLSFEDIFFVCRSGSDVENLQLACRVFTGDFSGGSDVDIEFDQVQAIDIEANSGSDLELYNMNAEKCKLHISGGSDAYLSGRVDLLDIDASGGSDVDAYRLTAKKGIFDLSGSSDADVVVEEELEVRLSGGADFYCKGSPNITYYDVCKSCDFEVR